MRRICVYCGSRVGDRADYLAAAESLGRLLVDEHIELVYGGGSVGMMGVLADAVLSAGGHVVGVIPELLAVKELLHPGVADMRLVPDMHARKALMADLADAFVALPGGFGTFEELFETITWAQLGIHAKPIGILNVAGYFDDLLSFLDRSFADGFIRPKYRELYHVAERPNDLLDRLRRHDPPAVERWLPKDKV
ncbi:MAG: TIGR00730 family Rossman fold protein [Planctomycetota bacterium]|nr:TIGR00730 family Rossman fold protein [Planctomycetaceae bacterium]MDQ3333206.1 TIGR00730 family Rossman fold protein [Planctomycetota bacterium]